MVNTSHLIKIMSFCKGYLISLAEKDKVQENTQLQTVTLILEPKLIGTQRDHLSKTVFMSTQNMFLVLTK